MDSVEIWILFSVSFCGSFVLAGCPNCLHDLCLWNLHCLYGCKTGYRGGHCVNECSNNGCQPNTDCYRDPVLINDMLRYNCAVCPDGLYRGDAPETFNCLAKCPVNCKSCSKANECHQCKAQYYNQGELRNCSTTCPDRCAACLSPSLCTECTPPYYNDADIFDCSLFPCLGHCKQCKGNKCSICVDGYFDISSNCSKLCPRNCASCLSEKICDRCKAGYYNGFELDSLRNTYRENCQWTCRQSCLECTGYRNCKTCIDGYYGSVCEKECSFRCKYNKCDKETGSCDCINYYSGDKCCVRSPNCKKCSSNTECTECKEGLYGGLCQYNCSTQCSSGCDISTGECYASLENTDEKDFEYSVKIVGITFAATALLTTAVIFLIQQARKRWKESCTKGSNAKHDDKAITNDACATYETLHTNTNRANTSEYLEILEDRARKDYENTDV